ncbi:MAG: hypothetical protein JWM59_4173 [Verrucomicrobiales bacterium]|nr:hypothetical protein [Verrucomicrobiales bacterium]
MTAALMMLPFQCLQAQDGSKNQEPKPRPKTETEKETASAFPLKAAPGARHLTDGKGQPWFYNADTAWMLFLKLTKEEAAEYLKDRKAKGFNTVQVMLTGFLGMKNREGRLPFGPEQDFARPDEAFFSHVEKVVEEAGRQGLLLAIAPAWSGCCGEGWAGKEKDGSLKPLNRNGEDKCRELGKYLGRRFGRFPNVMWIMGGDMDPDNARGEIRHLALGLKEAAPDQLLTYHAASSHSSTDVWPVDEPWLDVTMVYTYFRGFNKAWNKNQPDVYEVSHAEFAKSPVRPFFLGESTYEGEHADWGSALQARKQAYWAVLGGGFGNAYGSPNWNFPPQWREVMQLPGAASLRHFRRIFESRPWWTLQPDVKRKFLLEDERPTAANDSATAAVAADSGFAMVYLPSDRMVKIDPTVLSGKKLAGWWMEAATGKVSQVIDGPGKSGPWSTRPPAQGDWLLLLDDASRGYPPPG